jgi:hypothetical protein
VTNVACISGLSILVCVECFSTLYYTTFAPHLLLLQKEEEKR